MEIFKSSSANSSPLLSKFSPGMTLFVFEMKQCMKSFLESLCFQSFCIYGSINLFLTKYWKICTINTFCWFFDITQIDATNLIYESNKWLHFLELTCGHYNFLIGSLRMQKKFHIWYWLIATFTVFHADLQAAPPCVYNFYSFGRSFF